MRSSMLAGLLCAQAFAQQANTTYVTDINGARVADGNTRTTTSDSTTTRTELTQSINGRMVPLQSIEEKVIREDSAGRVVERIIRRYDANGNPGPAEKQQIEEQKNADGSVNSVVTTYRGDINGGYRLAERTRTEASKSGSTTTANVVIERPSLNGSMDLAERQTSVVTENPGSLESNVTTFRPNQQGQFVEALRVVTDAHEQNGTRVENVAQYEAASGESRGGLELASQRVTRSLKNPDGTMSSEVDVYRRVPGRAERQATPALTEREIIEQQMRNGRLVEVTSVQRPSINDPGRLGPPQKIGERICSGKDCK